MLEQYPNYVQQLRDKDIMALVRDVMVCNYMSSQSDKCNIVRLEAKARNLNPGYNGWRDWGL